MSLELDEDECRAVSEALDRYLPTLRFELARTEDRRLIHELNILEAMLSRVRARLQVALGRVHEESVSL